MEPVTFKDALEARAPPRRLGDVRLRHEGEVLFGEAVPGRGVPGWLPPAATATGLCCGVILLALSLGGGAPVPGLIVLAGCTAVGLWAGTRLRSARRGRRGFALHFLDHTLRIDRQVGLGGRPDTLRIPFEYVRVAGVTRAAGEDYALEVEFERAGRTQSEVLVRGISADELETAHRVADVLRGAFGLTDR